METPPCTRQELLKNYNYPGLQISQSSLPLTPVSPGHSISRPSTLFTSIQLPNAKVHKISLPNAHSSGLSNDVKEWTREHVATFLQWCKQEFDLSSVYLERFQLNGKALSLLTKADFEIRAPYAGDVIFNALLDFGKSNSSQVIANSLTPESPLKSSVGLSFGGRLGSGGMGFSGGTMYPSSPESLASPKGSTISLSRNGSNESGSQNRTLPWIHHQRPQELTSVSIPSGIEPKNEPSSPLLLETLTRKSTPALLLWEFLFKLLNDPSHHYKSVIIWKDATAQIFKIVNPELLAQLWGAHTQRNYASKMDYNKMSRSLRYYYRSKILRRVPHEHHCYQFLKSPDELKGIKSDRSSRRLNNAFQARLRRAFVWKSAQCVPIQPRPELESMTGNLREEFEKIGEPTDLCTRNFFLNS